MATLLSRISADQLEAFESRVARQYAAGRMPPINRVEMLVTEDCTLQCDYCFVNNKSHLKRMSWEVAKKAVDFLIERSSPDSDLEITFFGGEPLLEFPLVKQTAAYARQRANESGKRVSFSLTTNGTIMNEEIANFGQEYGFNLLLSIDGDRQAHDLHRVYAGSRKGCWDTVIGENFRLLRSKQGWMGARITVSPDTVSHLSSGVRTLFAMGVNQFLMGPDMDTEWTQDEMDIFASEKHRVVDFYLEAKGKGLPIRLMGFETGVEGLRSMYRHTWGCDAAVNKVAISAEGDMYPCCRFVSPFPGMEGYKLGSVYTGFTEIRTRMDFIDNGVDRRPRCANCDLGETCNGGCPATNLHGEGSLFIPSAFECFTKRLHRELLARIPKEMLIPDAPERFQMSRRVAPVSGNSSKGDTGSGRMKSENA